MRVMTDDASGKGASTGAVSDRAGAESPAVITLRVRRSHVVGALLILLGAGLGFGLGRVTTPDAVVVLPSPDQLSTPSVHDDRRAHPGSGGEKPVSFQVEGRPAEGPDNAAVTIVEFADYECPFCRRHAEQVLPQLRSRYGASVRYVHLHFPLKMHPHAQTAAEAAECAHRQQRFVPMYDALFANQGELDLPGLKRLAGEAGLDVDAFNTCLDSGAAAAQVESDAAQGRAAGVTGTPTFFVNGVRYAGVHPIDTWAKRLDAAIASARPPT